MQYLIEDQQPVFKPVKISLVFERVEELQEFQMRMQLYHSDLADRLPGAIAQFKRDSAIPVGNASLMSSITSLRKALDKLLGNRSLVNHFDRF